MDQQAYSPYTYSPFQSPMEMPLSHESHRCGSQGLATPEPCRESFDGNKYYTAVTQDWHVTAFPASPSTTSTLSDSDGFSTPRYVEQQPLPVFNLADPSLPIPSRTKSATSHPDWNVPMMASNWQEEYQDAPTWSTSQTFVAQPWHGNPNFFPSSIASTMPPVVPSMPLVMPIAAHNMARPHFQNAQHVQTQSGLGQEDYDEDYHEDDDEDYTVVGTSSPGSSSDDESDMSSSSTVSNSREPRMKVHKFPIYNGNQIHADYIRPHLCDLVDKRNPNKICGTRFVRPEHLRRHKKTVHAPVKDADFLCKVVGCDKRFNRGDNLRDHYFTHIERGGRSGKNRKMALRDMKHILGPKDKELYIKLVKKYRKHMEKKRREGPKL